MDLNRILAELNEEHTRIVNAILALEQIAEAKEPPIERKRGRPPGSRNKTKLMVVAKEPEQKQA